MSILIDSPNYINGKIEGYFLKVCNENGNHSGKYLTVAQYNALNEVEHKPVIESNYEPVSAIEESLVIEPSRKGRPRK
jgi:hypothetical protein